MGTKLKIESKEELINVLSEMLSNFDNVSGPKGIAICESLAKYDESLLIDPFYKGIPITIHKECFIHGKIIMQ